MRKKSVLELARSIDSARASTAERDFGSGQGRDLAVLLASAFPPLRPQTGWQLAAVEQIAREGWRLERDKTELRGQLFAAAGDLAEPEQFAEGLRKAVWAEKTRIALRELLPLRVGGASIEVTAAELSNLADVAFEVALAEAGAHVAARFGAPKRADGQPSTMVVVGLGKLGGRELNAGSDVDVVFFYDSDEGGSSLSLHDHFTRVARRAVTMLEARTASGSIWRVDLRLRPEGSRGPVVNSLAAAERYYETWGRMWERAALLRARVVAGDAVLGAELEREIVTPFVFRREVDPNLATTLAELVQRSRAELSPDPERDLKLGPGGIREAEFFVQSLQLIWGGREPSLRVPSFFGALSRLRSRGLVSDREAREIAGAYVLLRRVEHRVQWMTGIQTHSIPSVSDDLERLARTLGLPRSSELSSELERARSIVGELFASLAPHAPRPPPRHTALVAALDEGGELLAQTLSETTERVLGSAEIGEHLAVLARRPDGLLGELTRERWPALVDQVLDAILSSPDPVQAAHYLRSFFGRFHTPGPYVTALAEDPHALRRLVSVLGASSFVGEAVVSRPDLVDIVLFGRGQVGDPREVVETELDTARRTTAPGSEPWELRDEVMVALRRAKRRVTVEVAVADLAGIIETRQATRILSDLADEELDRAVRFELSEDPKGLCVIAVGKLGGREIGYGSDLDVLFIYDPESAPAGVDAGEYFARRAQRVIRLIGEPHPAGPGYELDTRLRPSGSHGMLVTSLASFARYHGVPVDRAVAEVQPGVLSSGAAWERQALLRARACAGDRELGARVIAISEVAAYERGAPPVEEMHRLRMRMQHELAGEREGRYDLKLGHGGLLDVEFATQWLQMRHGNDRMVRTPDTALALDALFARGYLARSDYETLRDGYRFLRRLEQRIHVLRGASSSIIEERGVGLSQLARRMGYEDTLSGPAERQLLERYQDVSREVRAAYERVLAL